MRLRYIIQLVVFVPMMAFTACSDETEIKPVDGSDAYIDFSISGGVAETVVTRAVGDQEDLASGEKLINTCEVLIFEVSNGMLIGHAEYQKDKTDQSENSVVVFNNVKAKVGKVRIVAIANAPKFYYKEGLMYNALKSEIVINQDVSQLETANFSPVFHSGELVKVIDEERTIERTDTQIKLALLPLPARIDVSLKIDGGSFSVENYQVDKVKCASKLLAKEGPVGEYVVDNSVSKESIINYTASESGLTFYTYQMEGPMVITMNGSFKESAEIEAVNKVFKIVLDKNMGIKSFDSGKIYKVTGTWRHSKGEFDIYVSCWESWGDIGVNYN